MQKFKPTLLVLLALTISNVTPVFAENRIKEEIACENGGPAKSCLDAAVRYINGDGVEKDVNRALKIMQDGCDRNLIAVCFGLQLAQKSIEENS